MSEENIDNSLEQSKTTDNPVSDLNQDWFLEILNSIKNEVLKISTSPKNFYGVYLVFLFGAIPKDLKSPAFKKHGLHQPRRKKRTCPRH